MMTKSITAIALAIMIALTSGAMAIARGQATSMMGTIVICSGHGPVTLNVDAQGQPVEALHICPDCAMTVLAALTTGGLHFNPQFLVTTAVRHVGDALVVHSLTKRGGDARAPPLKHVDI